MKTKNFPAAVSRRRNGALQRLLAMCPGDKPSEALWKVQISALEQRINESARDVRTKKRRAGSMT